MYFLNLRGAVDKLKTGPLSAEESLHYLTGLAVSGLLSAFIETMQKLSMGHRAQAPLPFDELLLPGVGALMMLGIIGAVVYAILRSYYRSNGDHPGCDFIPRVLVLTWVLGWRSASVALPIIIALRIFSAFSVERGSILFSAVAGIAALIGAAIYVVTSTNRCLKEISAHRKSSPSQLVL